MRPETMTQVVALLTESSQWVGQDGAAKAGESLEQLLQDLVRVDLEIEADASPAESVQVVCAALSPHLTDLVSALVVAFRQLAIEHDRLGPEVTSADVLRNLGVRAALRS